MCIDTQALEEMVLFLMQFFMLFAAIAGMVGLAYLTLKWARGAWSELWKR
jgi:hypothetical protein